MYSYIMSKPAKSVKMLPPKVGQALVKLGEDLGLARKRRKESLRVYATRVGVSVPTLRRMEQGDPTVGIAVYATALWLMNRSQYLESIADPRFDNEALTIEISNIMQARKNKHDTSHAVEVNAWLARQSMQKIIGKIKP